MEPEVSSWQPSESIFSPSLHPALDSAAIQDLVWRTLARTVLPSSLVECVLYFVWPERVWHSRLPSHKRLFLKQELIVLRSHLQSCHRTAGKVGLPVTLLLGSPGIFALHLPELVLNENDGQQDHICLAHSAEEMALITHWVSKHGSALRTLRVALDLREDVAMSVPAQGASALLFVLLARGELGRLNHLTLLQAGHATAAAREFLAPLARPGSAHLEKLRTLRLSLTEPQIPLRHLAALAGRGGLRGLQELSFFGEPRADDADVVVLLRALLATTHSLKELDLRASKAGLKSLTLLVERLETGSCPKLRAVQFEERPVHEPQVGALRSRMEELLQSQ